AMLPIRTILHPTDFSERSDYAFRLACSLARDHGAVIVVLHVVAPPVAVFGDGMAAALVEDQEREPKDQLAEVVSNDPAGTVSHRLAAGQPVEEILRAAKETQADLIVMGTHGWTGLDRWLMGSVAEHVVRRAECPVLTVKTPFPRPAAEG